MTRRRDVATPDLFQAFVPAPVVERFSAERVRAASCSARIARAVAEAIKQSHKSRADVANEMSVCLGEEISVAMLDQYTSTANEKNNIPAHRLVALLAVTGDVRVINAALQDTTFVAVDAKFEPLIRREMAKEARDRLDREIAAADAQWKVSK
jgi:hypothetical protein